MISMRDREQDDCRSVIPLQCKDVKNALGSGSASGRYPIPVLRSLILSHNVSRRPCSRQMPLPWLAPVSSDQQKFAKSVARLAHAHSKAAARI